MRTEQIRLLYSNARTGTLVTAIAAPALGYFQWRVSQHPVVLGWLLFILLVSVARFLLARRYWQTSPNCPAISRWSAAFAVGAGMAGAGWGAAGILLYPEAALNQVFLVFVLGGMMLGGASLLAPGRRRSWRSFSRPVSSPPYVFCLRAMKNILRWDYWSSYSLLPR